MTQHSSRREFLRQASALSALGASAPLALNFATAGAAAAQAATDYKALVCLFLYGGNDHYNTLVPVDAPSRGLYESIRTSIAVPLNAALEANELAKPGVDLWGGGRRFALNPALSQLKPLFDSRRLAVGMNVGTLMEQGTTLEKYKAGVNLPPKLFSHNDQQSVWQSSLAEGATQGWGGRMADVFAAANGTGAVFTSISASGNAVMMAGQEVVQYQVSASGATAIASPFGTEVTEAVRKLLTVDRANLMKKAHGAVARRAIDTEQTVSAALNAQAALQTVFPASSLGSQLKIVARMIQARQQLGVKRQVFFVSLGGFDHHDSLVTAQPPLLTIVGDALRAFYEATVELQVANKVTTFTGSDFGRTLANNGDGSDHGWGSYQFVMGDAVKGQSFFGRVPTLSVSANQDNVGGGRLLPAVGVDQYGATLAKWFGVGPSALGTVFPNLNRYTDIDLGFMR
jgi:uncharacterized protein (DUF1501 family)